jgi:hypothetical protein
MRFNPDTERGTDIAVIATQCANAVRRSAAPEPKILNRVWDCKNGGWILSATYPPNCNHML